MKSVDHILLLLLDCCRARRDKKAYRTTLVGGAIASLSAGSASRAPLMAATALRSEEHTSELQSRLHLVCRLLLEKKKKKPKCRGTHRRVHWRGQHESTDDHRPLP